MHGPVAVSRGKDWPSHNRNITSGVVVVSFATEVDVVRTAATKITITFTVDIDATTKERFTNGRLVVSIGGLGGGIMSRCNMPAGCGMC
jgi:hypothetical protein